MNVHECFSDSIYEEQTHLAERELSSFVADGTRLYGLKEARLSEERLARRIGAYGQPTSI